MQDFLSWIGLGDLLYQRTEDLLRRFKSRGLSRYIGEPDILEDTKQIAVREQVVFKTLQKFPQPGSTNVKFITGESGRKNMGNLSTK